MLLWGTDPALNSSLKLRRCRLVTALPSPRDSRINNSYPPVISMAGCRAHIARCGPVAFSMATSSTTPRKTIVYVDGFNLYYGALAYSPGRKWLDRLALSKRLLTQNDIVQVKYFTALVKPRPNNPGQNVRQQIYLRALKTLPCIEIYFGHFLSHAVRMPLAQPLPGRAIAEVIKTEEKGSDVNLASHLLMDPTLGRKDGKARLRGGLEPQAAQV